MSDLGWSDLPMHCVTRKARISPATPRCRHKEQSTTRAEDDCKNQCGANDIKLSHDKATQKKRPPYTAESSKATPKHCCWTEELATCTSRGILLPAATS